jgi:hypothetical protein
MPRGRSRKTADTALLKSAELIGWALGGLEREIVATKARLVSLTSQAATLRRRVGTRSAAAVEDVASAVKRGKRRKKRNLSPEARKRISDRMTKRWAEWRKKHKK